MRRIYKDSGKEIVGRLFLTAVLFAAAVWFLLAGMRRLTAESTEEGRKILEDSIRTAVVSCYALEGEYPMDLQYLEEHYGIRINRKTYAVFYEAFASNILPEVTVVVR